jgi:hypothetical protein
MAGTGSPDTWSDVTRLKHRLLRDQFVFGIKISRRQFGIVSRSQPEVVKGGE